VSCDQFQDSYELYALGALESAEANALREHLATGCSACNAEVRRAVRQGEIIFRTVPSIEPPAALRSRVESVFAPRRASRPSLVPWLIAVAAMLALVIGLVVQRRAYDAETQLARADAAQVQRLSHMLEILQAPGTVEVSFGPGKTTGPHGSLFIHKGLGIAMVVGGLPKAPAGLKYESWVVPKNGSPQPVEPFAPDPRGHAVTIVRGPVNVADLTALAVSLEPENSNPVRPTTVVFAAHV